MGFKCGIVGLLNAGKSTLFNALIKVSIEAVNFPFCIIELNTGVVPMPDPRLDQLVEIIKPQRTLLTTMEFVDTAGLVKGAPGDEGLGNQFLANIHEIEVIGYVIRCFENDNIIHVSGKVNPTDDIEVTNTELVLADLDTCERAIYRIQKKAKGGDKDTKAGLMVPEKRPPQLENAGMLRALDLSAEEKTAIRYLGFLTPKPTMYIIGVNGDGFENNLCLDQVREIAAKKGSVVVPVYVVVKADIAELGNEGCGEFMQELGLEEPSLNRVIRASYKLLNLQIYFTTRVKEVRAWTIPVDATAPQTADKIHADFERGLIRAQTISFEDFITYKGEQGAKEAGKMRTKGKDYIVKDGNVMNFLFSV